jgi:hypothetical protein
MNTDSTSQEYERRVSSFAKYCQFTIFGGLILGGIGLLISAYGSGTEHELVRRVGMSLFWSGGAIFLLAKGAGVLFPIYLTMRVCGFRVPKEQRFSMALWILGGAAMIFYGFVVLCLAWKRYFL